MKLALHFSRWAATLALALLPRLVLGQMSLAWKLEAGERYALHVEQQTQSTVTVVNKTVKSAIEVTVDSVWLVESIDDGRAKIRQTVGRVQVKVQAADSAVVAYDSSATEEPRGAVRDLAAAVGPLVDPRSSILLTMTVRGEIVSAELSPKLAELWDAGQGAGTGNPGAARESLDALLRQPLTILPSMRVAAGDSWEMTREIETPNGKLGQTTKYRYDGRREGAPGDVITYTTALTPAAQGKMKVKEQSQTGTIHFDVQAGRMLSGEQSQRLVTETPYRDATITVVVESQVKRTLSPQ